MSHNIVLTFALLYGATIALICAVYCYLMHLRNLREQRKLQNQNHNELEEGGK